MVGTSENARDYVVSTVQAVRLGTRDYLDTFRKEKKEQVAGGLKESGPEEPPIIDELCESLISLLPAICLCSNIVALPWDGLHRWCHRMTACLWGPHACGTLTDRHRTGY